MKNNKLRDLKQFPSLPSKKYFSYGTASALTLALYLLRAMVPLKLKKLTRLIALHHLKLFKLKAIKLIQQLPIMRLIINHLKI